MLYIYKLNLRFLKTNVKTNKIISPNSIFSFLCFIKIIIRANIQGYNIKFLKVFLKSIVKENNKKFVLVLDNLTAHKTPNVINFFRNFANMY